MREGSLEAPFRHKIDWRNPDFYDMDKINAEMHRVFDICHGCRRCFNLCDSFPRLFDLVDESPDEMAGVKTEDYKKVVDACTLCDLCFMTKCPYVPPHEWNLDFPHTMLRAKAIKFRKGEVKAGEKFLASTDVHGSFAGIPIVVQVANAVNKTRPARAAMESLLGVDQRAWLPSLATRKFRSSAPQAAATEVRNGERTPGKVAVFSTCFEHCAVQNDQGKWNDRLCRDGNEALCEWDPPGY